MASALGMEGLAAQPDRRYNAAEISCWAADDMREVLKVISASMWIFAFVGCAVVSYGFVGWYMVVSGDVSPGQALWVDDLAPEPVDAVWQAVLGAVIVVLALGVRAAIRRRLRPPPTAA